MGRARGARLALRLVADRVPAVTPAPPDDRAELAARDNEATYLLHCLEAARARLYSLACRCEATPLAHLSEADLLAVRQEATRVCDRLALELSSPAPPLPDLPRQP